MTVGLRLAPAPGADAPELSFFRMITTFGTAVDVTVSELAVEAFFPADAQTAEYLRGLSGPRAARRRTRGVRRLLLVPALALAVTCGADGARRSR